MAEPGGRRSAARNHRVEEYNPQILDGPAVGGRTRERKEKPADQILLEWCLSFCYHGGKHDTQAFFYTRSSLHPHAAAFSSYIYFLPVVPSPPMGFYIQGRAGSLALRVGILLLALRANNIRHWVVFRFRIGRHILKTYGSYYGPAHVLWACW